MQKKALFLFISLLYGCCCFAQAKRTFWLADPSTPIYSSYIIVPEEIIDTTKFTAIYQLKYRSDSRKAEYKHCRIALDIGTRYSVFYDLKQLENNLRHTLQRQSNREIQAILDSLALDRVPDTARPIGNWSPEILCDYKNGIVHFFEQLPYNSPALFVSSTEPFPRLEWRLSDDQTIKILGYTCFRAETTFRGRRWSAWYTPDIPYNNIRVWKLGGLPGMILRLEDEKVDYAIECTQLRTRNAPMWKYRRKKQILTYQKWQQMVRGIYENPLQTLFGNDCKVTTDDKNGKEVELDGTWTIPYNPIELE